MQTVVHVTHEAVQKIGGIGMVLEGLLTSRVYDDAVRRTILLGPLFNREGTAQTRLGRGGEVYYSSIDGRTDHPSANALREVERRWGVAIVYGRRKLRAVDTGFEASPEVILIDVGHINGEPMTLLKHRLFSVYGLHSDRYENVWEFEQYVRLAGPGLDAVKALGGMNREGPCVVVAHEFMGMPTALAAMACPEYGCQTVFYAHEVATVRKIVEDDPAHDTLFYNVLRAAQREGLKIEQVFGSQAHYFKHPLIAASRHCHNILAVGDYVVDELRFLGTEFDKADISLTYNGIPAYKATPAEDARSRGRLQRYADRLLGFAPDYVFTHVTRLVQSKGLWRDLAVLGHMEQAFRAAGKSAVLFVLSTEIGNPRRSDEVQKMEKQWDWPVAHREGLPDLTGGETRFYTKVQAFNTRSRCCKVVFINQFGFDRETCGLRMPEDMEFWDIRRGSDLEFGQSIYEPFGIAQVEALSYGCLCVMNAVCGCAGFVRKVTAGQPEPNAYIADYTVLDREVPSVKDALLVSPQDMQRVEAEVARRCGAWIVANLPATEAQSARLLERGHEIASRMSWDVIARDYFLPAVRKALDKAGRRQAAAAGV